MRESNAQKSEGSKMTPKQRFIIIMTAIICITMVGLAFSDAWRAAA